MKSSNWGILAWHILKKNLSRGRNEILLLQLYFLGNGVSIVVTGFDTGGCVPVR